MATLEYRIPVIMNEGKMVDEISIGKNIYVFLLIFFQFALTIVIVVGSIKNSLVCKDNIVATIQRYLFAMLFATIQKISICKDI